MRRNMPHVGASTRTRRGRPLIQHEDSGLTFRLAPQPLDPFVMEAVFIDDPLEGWPDAATMAAVGRASVWTFAHAQKLRYLERRTGPIYFRYREGNSDDYRPPYVVEDAPALFWGSHGGASLARVDRPIKCRMDLPHQVRIRLILRAYPIQ
jgi:hypothetical protein